jgi:hypothetical protein
MELRHLRYFVAVAELENVSRAALKLHVSQPALSAQIRDLEDELGFDLLERTPKSVRLTIAGRVFLDQTRAVLEHVDLAVKSARAAVTGGETELHVGYLGTPTAHLLPAILRAFQKSMPNVQVRLHEQSNEQNLRRLRERQLDLAFVVRTSNSPPSSRRSKANRASSRNATASPVSSQRLKLELASRSFRTRLRIGRRTRESAAIQPGTETGDARHCRTRRQTFISRRTILALCKTSRFAKIVAPLLVPKFQPKYANGFTFERRDSRRPLRAIKTTFQLAFRSARILRCECQCVVSRG